MFRELAGKLSAWSGETNGVTEDARLAVEVGDRALARRGLHERRVVDVEVGVELADRGGGKHAVGDRDRDRLSGAVIGDRDGVGHVAPSSTRKWVGLLSPRG